MINRFVLSCLLALFTIGHVASAKDSEIIKIEKKRKKRKTAATDNGRSGDRVPEYHLGAEFVLGGYGFSGGYWYADRILMELHYWTGASFYGRSSNSDYFGFRSSLPVWSTPKIGLGYRKTSFDDYGYFGEGREEDITSTGSSIAAYFSFTSGTDRTEIRPNFFGVLSYWEIEWFTIIQPLFATGFEIDNKYSRFSDEDLEEHKKSHLNPSVQILKLQYGFLF